MPILIELFRVLVKLMLADYSGNFVIALSPQIIASEVGEGITTYLVVPARP